MTRAIAIVAAGGILPGGHDPDGLWRLIESGRDALSDPPAGRWLLDPASIHDADGPSPDAVLCTKGGFLPNVVAPPRDGGLPAGVLDEMDPSVHVTLHAARAAWDAAQTDSLDPARVSVILGHIALPTESASALSRAVLGREIERQVTGSLPTDVPAPKRFAKHGMGLPALAVARDLGLTGRAFAIDAACASSLYALALACEDLREGRADAVIAGGASRPDSLYTQMGFSQLRALSRRGFCTPFDARGDGLVVGEGAVCFVLKRVQDAVAAGDEILGVIRGVGMSNDVDGSLLAPSSEGQLRALRAAYADAGWQPHDVDLIECHATGTPVGDAVEVASLRELWAAAPAGARCVIGGVKSNVGHLLTGAGAVGALKVLWALRHATLPPTAHFEQPAARVPLSGGPFDVLRVARTWERRANGGPRRAGVNAFGFGGTNAHVLIEEWTGDATPQDVVTPDEPIAVIGTARATTPVEIQAGRFRIPPTELRDMLAQQGLLLDAADRALDDGGAERSREPHVRAAVYGGIDLDLETTDYDLRWWAAARAPEWLRARGLDPDSTAGRAWVAATVEAVHEPLTADRVLGSLGGVVAARVAREVRFGGASMAVSSEGGSGITALQLAAEALARGALDLAVVGAVERRSDPRDGLDPDEGAAFLLKRLADAERDGDRVVALIEAGGGSGEQRPSSPETLWHAAHDVAMGLRRGAAWVRAYGEAPRAITVRGDDLLVAGPAITLTEPEASHANGPVAALAAGLFIARGADDAAVAARLDELAATTSGAMHDAAAAWWGAHRGDVGQVAVAVVARNAADLRERIAEARSLLDGAPHRHAEGARVFVAHEPLAAQGELAFVFPGSGSHFRGMGADLATAFPEIVTGGPGAETFAEELRPDVFWTGETSESDGDLRPHIQAQVAVGTMLSGLVRAFGVHPTAYLGYSLGETAALFASGAWKARREMIDRVAASDLFTAQLCGPCEAARAHWELAEGARIDWLLGVVAAPASAVRDALHGRERAYLLIVNTDDECVIGGARDDVERVVAALDRPFVALRGVTTVHCDVLGPVAAAYHALHVFDDAGPPPDGERIYSCAWGRAYEVTRTSGADSIVDNAQRGFDWPKTVRQAYEDGARVFVEIGPGRSCTRMTPRILGDRPHRAIALCARDADGPESLLRVLGALAVEGFVPDLSRLYARPAPRAVRPIVATVRSGMRDFVGPPMPEASPAPVARQGSLVAALAESAAARHAAHDAYLRLTDRTNRIVATGVATQHALIASGASTLERQPEVHARPAPVLDRSMALEFARGSIAAVLGPEWAEADTYPTRVRLPDEPYMFVDRVLSMEGEAFALTRGRIVTEHDVLQGQWYLDHDRIPTGLCIEAGQADLLLSAHLGADLRTKGLAVYRLLDAAVVFHGPLPQAGESIQFDIHIDRFFRQGDTHLFRFHFDGSVNGRPVLSMRDGCAGFFSPGELAAGQGIVLTARDKEPQQGKLPPDWRPFVPAERTSLGASQVEALRRGDLVTAFGASFADLPLARPSTLPPDERLRLMHRVTDLDPAGGRFGIGFVRTELDIHPDDWFLTCHFVDDMVMPGTLMYECSLHALRVYLMRLGFVAEADEVVWQPMTGIASRLRCRGQVTAETKMSAYEVHVKEIGFDPEPYFLADCLMYADGRAVVDMRDMTLRMSGVTRERLGAIWAGRSASVPGGEAARFLTKAGILDLANGNPSDALGPRWRPFDSDRFVARLPRPPYLYLDRITHVSRGPFEMREGIEVVGEWDVPAAASPEGWFFAAAGGDGDAACVPFAILVEAALQACGWCSAYMGSALTSEHDLHYRNLGGKATLRRPVHPGRPGQGTLRTSVRCTGVSASAGMILQHYAFDVRDAEGVVYDGTTYFGFFSAESLAQQVGVRDVSLALRAGGRPERAPDTGSFPRGRWRMLDEIEVLDVDGGAHGLGHVRGGIDVDPDAWFFRAHFKGDPVWPGSLGLESVVQALQVLAARVFPETGELVDPRGASGAPGEQVHRSRYVATAPGVPHEWQYRGQVVPTAGRVTVECDVTSRDPATRTITADALLAADGKVIYAMKGFSVRMD